MTLTGTHPSPHSGVTTRPTMTARGTVQGKSLPDDQQHDSGSRVGPSCSGTTCHGYHLQMTHGPRDLAQLLVAALDGLER